ncbi:hypothetical protein [Saccharopolyspora sp. SCSIO 74807]|uniref:hypothetical protein n=1 Tax=Saccharopolyspora sp. SCSIO 74807 TaxID=3118084 RepID=UPI0030CD70BC
MDPRDRADETLARARARGRFVVTPDSATSPMDASNTVRIPRDVVDAADRAGHDPNATRTLGRPERPQGTSQQYGQQQSSQQQYGQQQGSPQQGGQQQGGQYGQQRGGQQSEQYGWPVEEYGQDQLGQQLPPNPYQAQRPAGQFGPLGSQAAQHNQY